MPLITDTAMINFGALTECLAELKDHPNPKTVLERLSAIEVCSGMLCATGATKIVYKFVDHPECGELARDLCFKWICMSSTRSPFAPPRDSSTQCASPKRKIEAAEAVSPVKKAKIEEKTSSKPSEVPSKPSENKENMFTSKKDRTKIFAGKSTTPSLTPSISPIPSVDSRSVSPVEDWKDAKLKEIAARIAKKKAEKEATNRKTVVLPQTSTTKNGKRFTAMTALPMLRLK